ncbi:hypothetical protein [Nostoc sp.]|uniref:hypothetical protein n=1 Tax=Nostoc sp. TaxID=1180 RepID=UPI002FF5FF5D
MSNTQCPILDNKSLPFWHFSIILGHSFRANRKIKGYKPLNLFMGIINFEFGAYPFEETSYAQPLLREAT